MPLWLSIVGLSIVLALFIILILAHYKKITNKKLAAIAGAIVVVLGISGYSLKDFVELLWPQPDAGVTYDVSSLSEVPQQLQSEAKQLFAEYKKDSLTRQRSEGMEFSPLNATSYSVTLREVIMGFYTFDGLETRSDRVLDEYSCDFDVIQDGRKIETIKFPPEDDTVQFSGNGEPFSISCALTMSGTLYRDFISTTEGDLDINLGVIMRDRFSKPFMLRILDRYQNPYPNTHFIMGVRGGEGGIEFETDSEGFAVDTYRKKLCLFHPQKAESLVLFYDEDVYDEPYELASFHGGDKSVITVSIGMNPQIIGSEEDYDEIDDSMDEENEDTYDSLQSPGF